MVKGKPYIYLGKNTELYTHGEVYNFMESDYHWWKKIGFVIWMTTDKHPNSTDTDLGCAYSPAEFKRYFWEV